MENPFDPPCADPRPDQAPIRNCPYCRDQTLEGGFVHSSMSISWVKERPKFYQVRFTSGKRLVNTAVNDGYLCAFRCPQCAMVFIPPGA